MDVDRLLAPYFMLLDDYLGRRLPPERFQELLLARARQEEFLWPNRYVQLLEELLANVDAYRPPHLQRFPDDLGDPLLRRVCQRLQESLRSVHAAGKPRRKPRTRRERRRRQAG